MSSGCSEWNRLNRRSFLKAGGTTLGALAVGDAMFARVASTYAQSTGGTGNLLVLCELAGGLDALSFLAPFTNSTYQNRRPNLGLAAGDVTALPDNANYGINNLLPFFSQLYSDNELAFVQQVAYPNGNGSHFESQEIFKFGVRNLKATDATNASWYERLRRTYFNEPFGFLDTQSIGNPQSYGYPDSTFRNAAQEAFGRLARMRQGGNATQQAIRETYARIDQLGADLRERTENFTSTGGARGEFYRAAQLASADLGTQIIKLRYGGFDTHASQNDANQNLFPRVNNEFEQFVNDIKALGMWDRTTVVFYTEFGRRNEENGSPGTDHGYGSHMILAGPGVNAGLHGQAVTTADLNERSLPYYVDFRAVFSDCIRNWLGFNPDPIFKVGGETFDEQVGSALFS